MITNYEEFALLPCYSVAEIWFLLQGATLEEISIIRYVVDYEKRKYAIVDLYAMIEWFKIAEKKASDANQ